MAFSKHSQQPTIPGASWEPAPLPPPRPPLEGDFARGRAESLCAGLRCQHGLSPCPAADGHPSGGGRAGEPCVLRLTSGQQHLAPKPKSSPGRKISPCCTASRLWDSEQAQSCWHGFN